MSKKTPLHQAHIDLKALLVDFSGWQMPLHYGSQIEEHHAVRKNAGLFDVSHMGVIDITGPDAISFLRYVLTNDIHKLKNSGDALYTCMLNYQGGIIDDLIVYRFTNEYFRLVVNAGCRDKDFDWLQTQSTKFSVKINWREDCLLALQGPNSLEYLNFIFDKPIIQKVKNLKSFQCVHLEDQDIVIAKTGYTGEIGVEMMLPEKLAIEIWKKLIAAGVKPCGLGSRDTLRLEAGLNLYGVDMTEKTSPWISNLAWTVALQDISRDFIGKQALQAEKQNGITEKLVGLKLETRGVLRNHQTVRIDGVGLGEITSGSFSPTLNHAIALARIPVTDKTEATVERRGDWLPVKIVKTRFI